MGERLAADTEGDGLLETTTKLHCLWVCNLDTGEYDDYADQPGYKPIIEGIKRLEEADLVVGHNWIKHDAPVNKKLYPWYKPKGLVRDTLVLSKLFWNQIKETDFRKKSFPRHLLPRTHSLEAWGWRLGVKKDEFKGPWDAWSPTMHAYCKQDVRVLVALYEKCIEEAAEWGVPLEEATPKPEVSCVELEHRLAHIAHLIEVHGFKVNEEKLVALSAKLAARKHELTGALAEAFPPKLVQTEFVPKRSNKTKGYIKGVPFIKEKLVPFNPGSRLQIGERLLDLGWEPLEYNKDGTPSIDDETLDTLPWPQAKVLGEYLMVQKRLGQVATGKKAWLKKVKNGRIHGRIDTGGTLTGRVAHSDPNMGQVPACRAPYGPECRDAFEADLGHKLVGTDASALELRDLAGFMALWDGGDYINTILNGRKEDRTEVHFRNADVIGADRETTKTFFYAMIYGSGDPNLGVILGAQPSKARVVGMRAKKKLLEGIPALGALIETAQEVVSERGYLIGLDGRRLKPRSRLSTLNTLLQSAGAVQCKRWIVILFDLLTDVHKLTWGSDWAIVAWVHDELQKSVAPKFVELVKSVALSSIEAAGKFYNFACPLAGESKEGDTWAATH